MQDSRSVTPAIVLAAGQSARMGCNKLLIEIQGKPMLHWVLDALVQAGSNSVIVVTGHQAELVKASCRNFDSRLHFVYNPDFADGRATSIKTGLNALPSSARSALICPGDVPFVNPDLIRQLLAEFARVRLVTFPCVGGRKGHPVIFPSSTFPLLRKLRGDQTLHAYFQANPSVTQQIATDDTGCLLDFDTPLDLALLAGDGRKVPDQAKLEPNWRLDA